VTADCLVDCHVHVACPAIDASADAPPLATSRWWLEGGDEPTLAATLDRAAVHFAVVVQAVGLYGYDCRCAANAVAAGGGRYAFVGAVDMAARDPVAELEHLAASTPLAGIRLFGVADGGAAWLTDGRGRAVCHAAQALGTVAVPTVLPHDLPGLQALVEDEPDLVVALEHCGFPDLGPPGAFDRVLALSQVPSVYLKVTSHNLDVPGDPARFVDPLVEAFGAARLCWGSDFPQHQGLGYPEMVSLARRAARHLDEPGRDAFLAHNSLRLWWGGTGVSPPGEEHARER